MWNLRRSAEGQYLRAPIWGNKTVSLPQLSLTSDIWQPVPVTHQLRCIMVSASMVMYYTGYRLTQNVTLDKMSGHYSSTGKLKSNKTQHRSSQMVSFIFSLYSFIHVTYVLLSRNNGSSDEMIFSLVIKHCLDIRTMHISRLSSKLQWYSGQHSF